MYHFLYRCVWKKILKKNENKRWLLWKVALCKVQCHLVSQKSNWFVSAHFCWATAFSESRFVGYVVVQAIQSSVNKLFFRWITCESTHTAFKTSWIPSFTLKHIHVSFDEEEINSLFFIKIGEAWKFLTRRIKCYDALVYDIVFCCTMLHLRGRLLFACFLRDSSSVKWIHLVNS